MEDVVRIGSLCIREERRVDRARAVIEGEEHNSVAGADRRSLGGDFDTADEDLLFGTTAQQLRGPRRTDIPQHFFVKIHQVARHIQAQCFQFGLHSL